MKRTLATVAAGLALAFVFSVAAQLAFLLDPRVGAPWVLGVLALFLLLHWPKRSPRARRAAARVRLRPLGPARRWVLALAPPMFALVLGLIGMLEALSGPFEVPEILREEGELARYLESPAGWAVFALNAAIVAPIIEEFCFRGWVQRPLERRLGHRPAIVIAAALFAAYHIWYGHAELLLVPFTLGLVWGAAVARTGSIRAGVLLHALWNSAILLVDRFGPAAPEQVQASGSARAVAALLLFGLGLLALRRVFQRTP